MHHHRINRDQARGRRAALGLLAALPAAPAWLLSGCGGGEALIVPFITFVFEGVVTTAGGDQVVQLSIDPNGTLQGKSSGTLDGATISTRDPVAGTAGQNLAVTGTLSGRALDLQVAGAVAPLATPYTGRFAEDDTIVLTPSDSTLPSLTLVRVDNSFRPQLDNSTWTGTNAQGQPWTMAFRTRPPFDDGGTELLEGTDLLAGQPGTLVGYAAMRRLEITITRNATATHLSGRLGPAGTTPPANTSDLTPARTITFSDGSTLTRDA